MKHTAKRTWVLLLALLLVCASNPIQPTIAASPITLSVVPSVTEAKPGDEVTFSVVMGSATGTNLTSLQFDIAVPAGMLYIKGSGALDPNFAETLKFGEYTIGADTEPVFVPFAAFDDDNFLRVTGYGEQAYNGTDDVVICTFTCSVVAVGDSMVTLTNVRFYANSGITAVEVTLDSTNVTVSGDISQNLKTWRIPAVSEDDSLLFLGGWTVENIMMSHGDAVEWSNEDGFISVDSETKPFVAIAKLTQNGQIRYIGIEKLFKVSKETTFDDKTWSIPLGHTGSAAMELYGWKVTDILTDSAFLSCENGTKIVIHDSSNASAAIVKLVNSIGNTKLIGVEIKQV